MVVDVGSVGDSCVDICVPEAPDPGKGLENREGLTAVLGVVSKAEDFEVEELIGDWVLLFEGGAGDPRGTVW